MEHAALAVNRDKELRLYQRVHHFELFLAGVARYVQVGAALVDNLHALGEQLVDDAGELGVGDPGILTAPALLVAEACYHLRVIGLVGDS